MSFVERPLTWSEYSDFRKSCCRPFPGPVDYGADEKPTPDQLDYLNQAIHELNGEVAEVGEVIQKHQINIFSVLGRNELVDELGDVVFCADWVLGILVADWHGLGHDDDDTLEIISVADPEVLGRCHQIQQIFAGITPAREDLAYGMSEIYTSAFAMMVQAGLLSNSYKKLVYRQGKKYNVAVQAGRIGTLLAHTNMILFVLGVSMKECLEMNITKLVDRHHNPNRQSQILGLIHE